MKRQRRWYRPVVPVFVTARRYAAGRSTLLRLALLTLVYSLLTSLFTWPLVAHLADQVIAPIDPVDSIWRIGWGQELLLHRPWQLFTGNTFYPYPRSYLFDELLIGPALLTLPLRIIIHNPVTIYNLAVLSSFVLSALAMYALARRLRCPPAAAFAAGLIYAFAPLHLVHFTQYSGHLGLLSGQYFPLIILLLDHLFERPRWRTACALAAALAMQALSAQYYAYYLLFVVGGFVGLRVVQEGWRRRFPLPAVWARLIVAGTLAALVFLPFAIGYRMVQRDYGFERPLSENIFYSANLASFVTADSQNWFWGKLTASLRQGRYISARNLFPGVVALMLALCGALTTVRRASTQYLLLLGMIGAVLALGPVLALTIEPQSRLFAPLPYQFLYQYFPGFNAMRVPARFGILYGLSVAALAGCGLTRLMIVAARFRRNPRGTRVRAMALAYAVSAVICIESVNLPYTLTPLATGDRIPPVYTWLASQPQPQAAVIEFPFVAPTKEHEIAVNDRYEYFSLYHRHPIVNGSAGVVPKGYATLAEELTYGPTRRTLSILEGLEVTYLIVHYDQLTQDFGVRIANLTRSALATTPDLVYQEAAFGEDIVYRLRETTRYTRLRATIPRDATVFLSREDDLGTYGGMIGWVLRDNRIYTRLRLHFGQEYAGPPRPDLRYDYAVLYRREDPQAAGLTQAEVVWEDEIVRVFRNLAP